MFDLLKKNSKTKKKTHKAASHPAHGLVALIFSYDHHFDSFSYESVVLHGVRMCHTLPEVHLDKDGSMC